jgi:hypothetical protein
MNCVEVIGFIFVLLGVEGGNGIHRLIKLYLMRMIDGYYIQHKSTNPELSILILDS